MKLIHIVGHKINDIDKLKINLIKYINYKYNDNKSSNYNKLINEMKINKWCNYIKTRLEKYKLTILNKNIRNINISKYELMRITKLKTNHKQTIVLNADKNRGVVIHNKGKWNQMNINYMIQNRNNFIKNSIKCTKNILFKYKSYFYKFNQILRQLNCIKFNKFVFWNLDVNTKGT